VSQKQRGQLLGGSRPGLGDFAGSGKSRQSLPPIDNLRQAAAARLIHQRQVEALHRLGPRVVSELLDELGRHYGLQADIERRLGKYARLDPALLRVLGVDRFPPTPLRVMGAPSE
jgi:hypothetical protein